jgi:glyoxylase-like metal-dependent hydrolase (beta-lactamase superfamily II)
VRFEQYYLGCLSQASYLLGDEASGRAAVVDPRRDVGEYLDDAAAAGLRIEYVIETHLHADFLSGHLELAAATGATVIYGAGADVHFPHRTVADGPWRLARLVGDRRRHAWQWWEHPARLTRAGDVTIRARATDLAGRTQPDRPQWNPLGYANNAVHQVRLAVPRADR